MAKKSRLDSISVPNPCPESWDDMNGGKKFRFCGICEKNVYNISAMTAREADKLLFGSDEKLCIRMEKDAHGKIKTLKNQLHQITRQAPLAAGVLSATLALSAVTLAQGEPVRTNPDKVNVIQTAKDDASKPSISGTIYDETGAVIAKVGIKLRNVKDNSVQIATSNNTGDYRFSYLAPSVYEIEIDDVPGFKKFLAENIEVSGKNNLQLDMILQVREFEAMGDYTILPLKPPDQFTNKIVKTEKSGSLETTISGTITDQQGALISGVKVNLRDAKNNFSQEAVSNLEGFYRLNNVKASAYEIETEQDRGFKNYVNKNVVVDGKNNLSLNIALESSGEVVGIYGDSQEIKLSPSKIEEKINFIDVKELPVVGRDFVGLIGLTASSINKSPNQTGRIAFTVIDPADALIAGAKIVLTNQKSKKKFTASSNAKGNVEFGDLPTGNYKLRITADGFETKKVSLKIDEKTISNQKIILESKSIFVTVGMSEF